MRPALAVMVQSGILALSACAWNAAGAQQIAPPMPELVASTEARTPEEEKKGFHLPLGFEIELVASEPEIHKPMNLAFDDRGRLWVTSSLEYPFPPKPGEPTRDIVSVLEDFGPDGRARKTTVFADGLTIPIGVLPLSPTDAVVHSIPYIYHLTDSDGDGKADKREVYYGEYGYRDTHGMTSAFTWGFDGWIYACHGFSNTSTVQGSDKQAITMNSGNTYRFQRDGSHAEQWTWGQVNPFGLSFDPLGSLYSCDCHSRPIYQLLRGAYYSSFGKPDDGLGFGPEMMSHDHGSTGIAGITYYAAKQFPEAYRGTILVGNVVTSRINHDRIEWHGSSPKAIEQPDFLVSDDPWFRPVDIELGPDGALYVADFYNRIIGHYEVPLTHPGRDRHRGRIWRITYRGDEPHEEAVSPRTDWTTASPDDLGKDLGHPNLAVRVKAMNQLATRGGNGSEQVARQALADDSNANGRAAGLWVLHRIGKLDQDVLQLATSDSDRLVRVHSFKVIAERAELPTSERKLTWNGLSDEDPFVRRAAADALGRHPDPSNIRPLLDARKHVAGDDTHLLHVVRMALRDQLLDPEAWRVVEQPDQMSEEDLRLLADVAPGVPNIEAARFLLAHLDLFAGDAALLSRFVHHVARYGDESLETQLLAWLKSQQSLPPERQSQVLQELFRGDQERGAAISKSTRDYAVSLAKNLLSAQDGGQRVNGIALANVLRLAEVRPSLEAIVAQPELGEDVRSPALDALVAVGPAEAIPMLKVVLVDSAAPVGLRTKAADALGGMNNNEAREALAAALPLASARLQSAFAAALAGNREGADRLLGLVEAGKASARLLQERPVQLRLDQAGLTGLAERLAKLTAGLPPAEAQVQELIDRRRRGFAKAPTDAEKGALVFEKKCAVCHQLEGKGAKIGPQLEGIGIRGPERLMEDILDPNRNVDQAFRTTTLALQNGQVVNGLLLREEGQILVLADSEGKEVRIPKNEVEEQTTAQLSLMPANLSDQIEEADFYHLIEFLRGHTEAPATSEAKR